LIMKRVIPSVIDLIWRLVKSFPTGAEVGSEPRPGDGSP
jgi:hypothetical protein